VTVSFEEFIQKVRRSLTDYMPDRYRGCEVEITEAVKENDSVMHAVSLKGIDKSVVPRIYLETYYPLVQDGQGVRTVLCQMAQTYVQACESAGNFSSFPHDYEEARELLGARVFSLSCNRTLTENMVYEDAGCGLGLSSYVRIDGGERGLGVVQITRELAKRLGYPEGDLVRHALENAARTDPAELSTVGNLLNELDPGGYVPDFPEEEKELYVLTTRYRTYGAAALFYPGEMEWLASRLKGSYYVLPSSVHEFLLFPDYGDVDPDELLKVVD